VCWVDAHTQYSAVNSEDGLDCQDAHESPAMEVDEDNSLDEAMDFLDIECDAIGWEGPLFS
jgi:hypothetical protein